MADNQNEFVRDVPERCDDVTVDGDPCMAPVVRGSTKCSVHKYKSNIIEYHPDMDELPIAETVNARQRRMARQRKSYKPRPKWLDKALKENQPVTSAEDLDALFDDLEK